MYQDSETKQQGDQYTDIHKVYHSFCNELGSDFDGYKYEGYELMCKAQEWAKKFPNDVHIVGCDDDVHAGAVLLLIEHKSDRGYWGTTVVLMEQFKPKPCQFFLYPDHQKELSKVLKAISKQKEMDL